MIGQPAREQRRNGRRDQIQRHDPRHLVLRRRQRAADLGQHHIGRSDGHAERNGRHLHQQQDQPLTRGDTRVVRARRIFCRGHRDSCVAVRTGRRTHRLRRKLMLVVWPLTPIQQTIEHGTVFDDRIQPGIDR